jgi:hypothetical protein
VTLDTLTSYRTVIKKYGYAFEKGDAAIAAIKEALAQPEQEPNGYVQTVIEALYENGDPVSVDAAELLQRITAQQEQVPVARIGMIGEDHFADVCSKAGGDSNTPLYTAPPKRKEWVGLTEKDSELVYEDVSGQSLRPQDYRLVLKFAVAIEAKLKELNT